MFDRKLRRYVRNALLTVGVMTLAAQPAFALGEDIQCVPYARQLSGIEIYGDALTWWKQAKGEYARGHRPQVGSVLAFRPHGNMRSGHVAAVSRIIDQRTLLVSHSNWSTINGTRGHVENNVKVVDVSKANNWSRVRVWYTPIGALGGTKWPTYGFIYPDKAPAGAPVMVASKTPEPKPAAHPQRKPSRNLLTQVGGNWVKNAAMREQRQRPPSAQSAAPASATAYQSRTNQPTGYTPARNEGQVAASGPNNLAELLRRY